MDLLAEWANMGAEINKTSASAEYALTVQKESTGIMKTLVKNLNYKKNWVRVFSLLALVGMVLTEGTLRYLLLSIFLVYEVAHLVISHKLKNIDLEVNYHEASKTVLLKQLGLVKQLLKVERIWGYVFMPLAGPVGYLISRLVLGNSMEAILHHPNILTHLLLCLLISCLGIPLANWMNKLAFGSYIQDLQHKLNTYEQDSLS